MTIYLSDDEDNSYTEKYVIPIRYDRLSNEIFIDDSEYKKLMTDNDVGIDLEEINLIQKIMQYLDNHKEKIKYYFQKLSVTRNKSLTS